ncbi:MAG: response regulator transcription factor [Bacteroidota bacterium]
MPDLTLIIDDDPAFNAILVRSMERRGRPACGALDPAAALEMAGARQPGRIVLDLNLNGSSGLALIPELLAINPACRIVVLTGYASITTAVDAIKLGAIQYLAKPVEIEAILGAFDQDEEPDLDLPAPDAPLSVDRLEWEHIQRVLNENDGNISATARALKMHRRTLQRKLAKHPVRQ